MRLIVITSNPDRASFRQRIGNYLDMFSAKGLASEVAVLPAGLGARRELFRRAGEFDGVFLHKKKLNVHDAFFLRRYSKKIIYNYDDAIMYNSKRPDRYSRAHAVPFRRTVKLADMVVVGSSYLARRATPFNGNVRVLPLGLNIDDYHVDASPKSDDRLRLVWIGSESTLRYLDAIRPALEEVAERFGNVTLRVICDIFPDWPNIQCEEIQWSPENRCNGLATSDIGLAPLPDDPFAQGKCSFKVLEYSASALPVVASPVGTNSEHVREGSTGFIAGGTDEWIDRLTRLMGDPERRAAMGKAGRAWAEQFDINVIGDKFHKLVSGCLRGPVSLAEQG